MRYWFNSWYDVCRTDRSPCPQITSNMLPIESQCCCCSVTKSCSTLCDPAEWQWRQANFPVLHYLVQTHVHWVGDAIQPSHSLSPSPPASIFPSIRVFSNELAVHIRWWKFWSFSFSLSPSNEYLELISFRIDWSDLLAVQGTLKSLLQHHSSKASILQCTHSYMTTGKPVTLPLLAKRCLSLF